MIVVALTSWVKRIGNVKVVVKSVMENSLQPDRVYLNLSKTEFKGIDIPKDLVDYFNSDDRLVINWIDGENTKTMKKVFPILKYLKDDDIIINIDDDALIPKEFIKNRYDEFIKTGSPITSCNNPKWHYVNKELGVWSCGAGSIFRKKMLRGYEEFMNDKLIHCYNDDWCYTTLLWLNGYKFKPCTSYSMQNGSIDKNSTKLKKYNDVEPMGKTHQYVDQNRMYELLNERIEQMFGVSFDKAFNAFGNRHDCVMVYGKSGVNSEEMTCGDHLEMEYVIASLKKYCSSWCGRIFIVGSEPPKCIKDDVIHIPCDNPYTHCKDANIIHKLRYACEHIPDLSDDLLMISDDQIVTKPSSWEDMKPRIVRKYSDWSENKWQSNRRIDFWHECLYQTLMLFPKDRAAFWEPHIWSPINKTKFMEMCKKYDYTHNSNCIIFTLYYNFINQKPERGYDHNHLSDSTSLRKIKAFNPLNIPRHLSWTDTAFSQKKFRDLLDVIVGFKDKSYGYGGTFKSSLKPPQSDSIKKTKSRIEQLREDIANGRVVKMPSPNGLGFVWKRVK